MNDSAHNLPARPQSDALAVEGDFPIDPEVAAKFPNGAKVVTAHRFAKPTWTVTARLAVELPDGTRELYFLKCDTEDASRLLMEGEFNAMSELYKWAPGLVPKPHSWGKYRDSHPETYFYLSEFIDMKSTLPDPDKLCSKLSRLHKTSFSPNGQFGFHATTCQGRTPQAVSWEPTWTGFFSKLLRHATDLDFKANGYWEGLDVLEERILSNIVPRLIGALERDGRTVKPSLIHADLWEGNTGTSQEGNVYVFDSGAFYAHHEMEIGNWRCNYNQINKDDIYTIAYDQYNERSDPKEEWDDRNRMYCIYFNVIYSVNHRSEGKAVRQT